ncbi:Uncharacterised protein [Vibrio cholerae]|nr:Uncharacterised protein [Vibrio cholerae]
MTSGATPCSIAFFATAKAIFFETEWIDSRGGNNGP